MAKKTQEEVGKGYWGRVLFVDLTKRSVSFEEVDDSVYAQVLSGAGLGARILWDTIQPGCDPMGPGNVLGFTTGVLTDTPTLFSGRFTVVGKSPATGGWGDANCGGYFAPALKRCRVDGVFFTGAADSPVYLYMDHDTATIRDASDLWGKDFVTAEKILKERHGKRAQVAGIGQAGENKSFIAGICNDGGRIAARAGLGGVMGAKNLKAVVCTGKARVGVADRERMQELTKAYRKRIDRFDFAQKLLNDRLLGMTGKITRLTPVYPRQPADLWRLLLKKFGTPCLTAMSAESGDSPIKNWEGAGVTDYPLKRSQRVGAESVTAFERKKYGCYSC
ncbi:MAG: aldehyde ferredoxin oxidoreductase, partial [Deltaproteobacteria bacterium]|nr:aldehyde ferredoxin oxidoreductase [Deltaproteobacteria bacterium]